MNPTSNPPPAFNYRQSQGSIIPGLDALYRSMLAIFDTVLAPGSRLLIVGAGGGREIETLGPSEQGYVMVGLDPMAEMLALAQPYADDPRWKDRVTLIQGAVQDAPMNAHLGELFAAATSILVMHLLPDDGTKLRYLKSIREKLKPNAPLIHAEITFAGRKAFERLAPVASRYAEVSGLPREAVQWMISKVADYSVVPETRTLELMEQSGFTLVAPIFRGLWFAGWWLETAP